MKENYCIALQPIALTNAVNVSDDMLATARVTNITFYEFGLERLVGNRKLLC